MRALAWIALASAVAFVPDGRAIRHDVTADDGHRIALWEKHASPENAVILLIHGRTWSSLPNFDLDVPGERRSVMDAFVASGLTAYAIDLRGYGATPRDASGCLSPDRAVADVKAVTDWIAQNDGRGGRVRRPAILGLSRGALVAASFAQQYPDRVSALVLLGFGYDPDVRFQRTPDAALKKRNTEADAASDFITAGATTRATIDAFTARALAADPVLADWCRDEQFNTFSPSRITVPVLLVHGARDPQATFERQTKIFARLKVADRSWVILPGADHAAHLENALPQLVRAVAWFVGQH